MVAATSGVLLVLLTGAVIIGKSWERVTERTYYGAKGQRAIVQDGPAWDEDSCDPDRPINIALPSGESISMPRRFLHR